MSPLRIAATAAVALSSTRLLVRRGGWRLRRHGNDHSSYHLRRCDEKFAALNYRSTNQNSLPIRLCPSQRAESTRTVNVLSSDTVEPAKRFLSVQSARRSSPGSVSGLQSPGRRSPWARPFPPQSPRGAWCAPSATRQESAIHCPIAK
jgi:hypothetical protein